MEPKSRAFAYGMIFESGLGFLGLAIAWVARIPIAEHLQLSSDGVRRGLLAVVPMLVLLGLINLIGWRPLVELRRQVEQMVSELFAGGHWWDVLVISIAAGVGEELLFRGALQPLLAEWTNPWIALVVVSLLFGLAHALSTSYFVVATLIGAYFGWLAMHYDDLVAPIVAHAAYDFVAILFFRWRVRAD